MKVGIGHCDEEDAFSSGRRAAETAMEKGGLDVAGLAFAFCRGKVDHDEFLKGLQSVLGDGVPVVGGSAIGIITNDYLSYEGHASGVAVMEADGLHRNVAAIGDVDKDERLAGQRLGRKLSNGSDHELMLMFWDSVKSPPTQTAPPIMNASGPLIEGIKEASESNVPILGAGIVGDYEFSPTKQFCGSHVGSQSVVGVLLSGSFKTYFRIMHGCTPKDGIYHTITKIEGPILYEMDGKPVVEIIDEVYGNQDWREQVPVKRLTIGVNYGEKFGDYEEGHYINRLITGVLPNGEGVVLFEPDLEKGTEVLFMLRDNKTAIESAQRNSAGIMEEIKADGKTPFFGFYVDCAGRTARFSDSLTEEASKVQQVFKEHNTPLLGFYSGVEVAPILGKSRGLDWTGVLIVLAME